MMQKPINKATIEQFYKDVDGLELKFPVAAITKATKFSKGVVSEYLSRTKEPSEKFLIAFYRAFPKSSQNVPHGTDGQNSMVGEKSGQYGSDLDRPLPIGDVSVTLRDYIDLLKRVAETRLLGIEVSLETLLDRQKTNIALVKTILQRDAESKAGGDLKKTLAESYKIDKLSAANRDKDSHVGIVDGMDKKGKG